MKFLVLISLFASVFCATRTTTTTTTTTDSASTDPQIYSWVQATGTSSTYSAVNNVNKIQYTSTWTYVSASSIPSYSIGPWSANPNTPSDQSFTYKFRRSPVVSTTKTATKMGTIGLWLNGLAIYNALDGYSYNSLGVWNRNAYYWEKVSFDACNGHPDGSGTYHNHVNPICMYDATDSTTHSPIIGWAFDGYPIYGPYGYNDATSSDSAIRKILTSYKARSITQRTTLANGTVLDSTYYGPDVSTTYPIGSYIEDYEYSSGYGDLDEYNGRFAVTPEYPSGTYAYYVTTDSSGNPEYPFSIGPYYYGVVASENLSSSSVTVASSTTTYYSYS